MDYHKIHARKAVTSGVMLAFSVAMFALCVLSFRHAMATGNGDGAGAVFLFVLGTLYLIGTYTVSIFRRVELYNRTKPRA